MHQKLILQQLIDLLGHQLIILNEAQRLPGIFSILRGVIDQRGRNRDAAATQFLLLGSASGVLLQPTKARTAV
jgi:hypothetical protein